MEKKSYDIQIDGMNCRSCVVKIQNAVSALEGVQLSIDFAQKTASVDVLSDTVEIGDVVNKIEALGYKAANIS